MSTSHLNIQLCFAQVWALPKALVNTAAKKTRSNRLRKHLWGWVYASILAAGACPFAVSQSISSAQVQQQTDFEHALYAYFQGQYDSTLTLIEVAERRHQFSALDQANLDRLRLIQGASELNIGLYEQALKRLNTLLAQSSSPYIQANTWYWLAKAGLKNKRFDLAQQAFSIISERALNEHITHEQWQELIYLNAYWRMQQGQAWEDLAKQLSDDTFYRAYLLANLGSIQFNQQNYEQAETAFIEAKQSILASRANPQLSASNRFANWINPSNWFIEDFSVDRAAVEQAQALVQTELDALYDRVNLGLAYSLLKQGDDANALEVVTAVSIDGGDAEQAMLTLGWAMAQDERLVQAKQVWHYLQQRSSGLYRLQASYGLAYAYQLEGEFADAFFALEDTSAQIDQSIASLEAFAGEVRRSGFFDQLSFVNKLELSDAQAGANIQPSMSSWPDDLLDIKQLFLSPSATSRFDARYLLLVRQQARQSMGALQSKLASLATFEQMLELRQARYLQRQQALSLKQTQVQLSHTRQALETINAKITQHPGQPNAEIALAKKMATPAQSKQLRRLKSAQLRLKSIHADESHKSNESSALPENVEQRLTRIEGLLHWQLYDNFTLRRQQHLILLDDAIKAMRSAQDQFERLRLAKQNTQLFEQQSQSIDQNKLRILGLYEQAREIFNQADLRLQNALLNLIRLRIEQLTSQQVNTRLAMLRLQDLAPSE
ncbi:hypothetical protein PN836_013000 [Ningiella sp. W23]|uniref:hypothetical protein n=1 Tax=Ningiella sp. W23 TaxID=3023715 RepID=UPI00375831E5